MLSSADPNAVALQGGTDYLRLNAVRIRPNGTFNPRWLLSGNLSRHGQVLSNSAFGGYRLTLETRQDIHLALLGPVPLGAWVPFPGSQVSLAPSPSQFPQTREVPQMVERYPSDIGYSKGPGKTTQPQAYPIGDFLGPNLVIWSSDPSAQMPGTPLRAPTQPGVVTALLIGRSDFSTRIGVVPTSDKDLAARRQIDAKSPVQAQQDVFYGDSDGGRVTLTVNEPLGSTAYNALRQRTAAHPNIFMSVMANPYAAAPNGAIVPAPPANGGPAPPVRYQVQEHFPPLPLYTGFNVFGPLRQVLFSGGYGHVTVGASPLDLAGSADLELDNVRGLRNADNQQLLSAPLATSSQSANLEFRAVGAVKVNGEAQSTFLQQHSQVIGALSIVLALVGVVFGVLSFLQGMRLFSKEANRT